MPRSLPKLNCMQMHATIAAYFEPGDGNGRIATFTVWTAHFMPMRSWPTVGQLPSTLNEGASHHAHRLYAVTVERPIATALDGRLWGSNFFFTLAGNITKQYALHSKGEQAGEVLCVIWASSQPCCPSLSPSQADEGSVLQLGVPFMASFLGRLDFVKNCCVWLGATKPAWQQRAELDANKAWLASAPRRVRGRRIGNGTFPVRHLPGPAVSCARCRKHNCGIVAASTAGCEPSHSGRRFATVFRVHAATVCAAVICRCAFFRCQPPVLPCRWHRNG